VQIEWLLCASAGCMLFTGNVIMAAVWYRAGHYIFAVVSFFLFFPRLMSAVGDWMSAILPHMMWP